MEEETPKSLAEALKDLPDPRRKQRRAHELVPILLTSVTAMACGSRSLYAIAQWARERLEDDPALLERLGLKPGMSPSVATLHRVFKRLDVKSFERILGEWLSRTAGEPEDREVLATDGKTLRGIHGEEIPGVHLVALYNCRSSAVLAQASAGGKGTELTAVKEVISEAADLKGAVVTGDALQTQREICERIKKKGEIISSS